MPIVRADVPEWLSADQKQEIRRGLHNCIARTWATEHIWIAVSPMATEEDERTVMMTVDLREGRGQEKERTEALFDLALETLSRVVGTKPDELILLVRQFHQEDCLSRGGQLPPLEVLTPSLEGLRAVQGAA